MLSDTHRAKKDVKVMFTKIDMSREEGDKAVNRQNRKNLDQRLIQKQKLQILNS